MSDIGELYREWKEHYRDVKVNAKRKRLDFLHKSNIDYEILNLRIGHVRVATNKAKYDTWLSTGKWTKVGTNKYYQSWTELLKKIEKDGEE